MPIPVKAYFLPLHFPPSAAFCYAIRNNGPFTLSASEIIDDPLDVELALLCLVSNVSNVSRRARALIGCSSTSSESRTLIDAELEGRGECAWLDGDPIWGDGGGEPLIQW